MVLLLPPPLCLICFPCIIDIDSGVDLSLSGDNKKTSTILLPLHNIDNSIKTKQSIEIVCAEKYERTQAKGLKNDGNFLTVNNRLLSLYVSTFIHFQYSLPILKCFTSSVFFKALELSIQLAASKGNNNSEVP